MDTRKLQQFFNAILEEAENNPEFSRKLEAILYGESAPRISSLRPRASNRRDPAVLDPVDELSAGEEHLKARLRGLSEKELKDIIAEYRMDTSKRAMRWKSVDKLIDFIVEAAKNTATKGDAFR